MKNKRPEITDPSTIHQIFVIESAATSAGMGGERNLSRDVQNTTLGPLSRAKYLGIPLPVWIYNKRARLKVTNE
jgi:hypothetical protein